MTVEFISAVNTRPGDELNPQPGGRPLDPAYLRRYARTLEDAGFDYTLVPYGSSSADSFVVATAVAAATERIKPIVAVRPNTVFPLVAAQQLATLDQISDGRAVVHIISGGSDAEQARQGDYLSKDERYDRSEEWIRIVRRAWTEREPFSHEGTYYRFDDFGPGFPPAGIIPISVGGSSDAAYRVGGALGDIFGLWGEPLADTREQIARVNAEAAAAGRADRPRIWVTFRPIVAETDELAWEKAHRHIGRVAETYANAGLVPFRHHSKAAPQNVGSQRLLDAAARGELHDRALWTKPAEVTNAGGASTALVGSYETVAAAILDYVDLGADLVSIRGYDNLNDAIDYGRYVLPLVRQELAHREATGARGQVVPQPPIVEGARTLESARG
ncbi:LLM class flavin-dependent oxidoreductase [Microbacterium fluvii]|uniref:LLM class flavin-dependent oxidoreductase n=1 Tax=Microbacterium fluvii TaxID=415215 RepID=A0ABW2HG97_9MICO|nr:LLM class flavin-dependent oxidoreductase [Microbacterium fluvii]MCU4673099.1 LLM class flavin-dependent oxidoreductase [Microbacterium fluvii]